MPSSTSSQEHEDPTAQNAFMARSLSTLPPGGEINISTPGSPRTAKPTSAPPEQEAKAETVFSLSHGSEAGLKAPNTTQQAAVTSPKEPPQRTRTTTGHSMALPDLATRMSRSGISEGEINISLPVPSSLLRQDKGTQTSESDLADLFHRYVGDLRASKTVDQAPSTTFERATHDSSRAAVTSHEEEAQAQISPETGPKVEKLTGSRNKSNKRIDAADVSAPFWGSRSWHPLTSTQKPVVKLPPVSTSYRQHQPIPNRPQQKPAVTPEPPSTLSPHIREDQPREPADLPTPLLNVGDTAQMRPPLPKAVNLIDAEDIPQPPTQLQENYVVTNVRDPERRYRLPRRIPIQDGQRMRPLTPSPPPVPMEILSPASTTPDVLAPVTTAAMITAPITTTSITASSIPTAPNPTTRPPGTAISYTLWDFCPCNIQGHSCQQYTRCQFNPGLLCTVRVRSPSFIAHPPSLPCSTC
ncbi:hypothetical protein G7Y79_00042g078660 [Physcia stellaris]|nr:hypothetical protein G7Y79_00042g078660 [Physcia stellaris]